MSAETKNLMGYSKRIDWRLIVAIVALVISVFAGSFWRVPDIVFDKRPVEIPLSDPLREAINQALAANHPDSLAVAKNGVPVSSSAHLPSMTLPDKLLYVDVRNVGHVPSSKVKVHIVVPGPIADKQISDAGAAFGPTSGLVESGADGDMAFEIDNLANDQRARVSVAIWYQQTKVGTPTVEVQDIASGPAREVAAVSSASFYWWAWIAPSASFFIAIIGVLTSLLVSSDSLFRIRYKRNPKSENPQT